MQNDKETTENGTSGTKPGHARRGSDLHKKLGQYTLFSILYYCGILLLCREGHIAQV